jgi:putative transposase
MKENTPLPCLILQEGLNMARIARVVAVGYPHHITQRGNYGQTIFFNDKDRKLYLEWIQEYSNKFGLALLSDCLMSNHVHFIGIPEKEDSMAKTFNAAHMRYAHYFNKKSKVKGHLWQGRFYSCVLDENHLISTAKYIERNPVRAGLVKTPWEWKWSSASNHIGQDCSQQLKLKDLFQFIPIEQKEWKDYISAEDKEKDMEMIKKKTLTGQPLCGEQALKKLEDKFGRRLHTLLIGRPKKEKI